MTEPDDTSDATEALLADVGPRLKRLRQKRRRTLSDLAEATGISVSTLSRLEGGKRRPTLELLLPLVRAYQITLDELVGDQDVADPRVHSKPHEANGMIVLPLTKQPASPVAYKLIIPADRREPETRSHAGYEWLYVLSGKLRLVLAGQDVVLRPGEAAEFDTRLPHWFGSTGEGPVEILSLFGRQGERMHLRTKPSRRS